MAIKYKDLVDAGRTDTIREMTREEMLYGKPEGYSTLQVYSPQQPGDVSERGNWGIGDNAFMSDEDYNTLKGYQSKWFDAQAANDQAGMDAAHEAAQQLRYKYGYSGGADGTKYNTVIAYTAGMPNEDKGSKWHTVSGSGAGGAGGYNSQYQARIDALTDAILNREAFSYDKESDPLYQQYEDSYTRNGQRAMQDTLAQVSARTGGLASSYAGLASQQSFNNYMAALADKVPELYQLAYSMYMDDLEQDRLDLSTLVDLDGIGYDRYRDTVADSQWQQNFDYNAGRDAVADSQWAQQFAYQQAQDALDQQNWQTQWDYQLLQDAQKAAAAGKTSSLKAAAQPTADETGMSAGAKTQITQAYPSGQIPASVWNQLAAQYGEAALVAAGFSQEANNKQSKNRIQVPGYGNVTYDEAEQLERTGRLVMVDVDENGDPVYALASNNLKTNSQIGLTR